MATTVTETNTEAALLREICKLLEWDIRDYQGTSVLVPANASDSPIRLLCEGFNIIGTALRVLWEQGKLAVERIALGPGWLLCLRRECPNGYKSLGAFPTQFSAIIAGLEKLEKPEAARAEEIKTLDRLFHELVASFARLEEHIKVAQLGNLEVKP